MVNLVVGFYSAFIVAISNSADSRAGAVSPCWFEWQSAAKAILRLLISKKVGRVLK